MSNKYFIIFLMLISAYAQATDSNELVGRESPYRLTGYAGSGVYLASGLIKGGVISLYVIFKMIDSCAQRINQDILGLITSLPKDVLQSFITMRIVSTFIQETTRNKLMFWIGQHIGYCVSWYFLQKKLLKENAFSVWASSLLSLLLQNFVLSPYEFNAISTYAGQS